MYKKLCYRKEESASVVLSIDTTDVQKGHAFCAKSAARFMLSSFIAIDANSALNDLCYYRVKI